MALIRDVLRDTVVYGFAAIFSRGLALIVLPFYTRVLTPSDYGALDIIVTLGAVVNLVVALEVAQGVARYWNEMTDAEERRCMASSAFWFSCLAYGTFFLISFVFLKEINSHLLGSPDFATPLVIGLLFMSLNGIFNFFQSQYRWEMRSRAYALISIIYAACTMLFGIGFGYSMNLGLSGVLAGQLAAVAVSIIAAWWGLRNSFSLHLSRKHLRQLLAFSAPLVPAGLAMFIGLYFNRLVINAFEGLHDVGIFGIATRLASAATLLIIGIQGALTPLIYAQYKDPATPPQLVRLFEGFLVVALLGCLVLGLFSREIIYIFSTSEYQAAAPIVSVLAPGMLLSQMYIFAPGIAIYKKTRWQLWITLAMASLNVLLNLSLVPSAGMFGAALATLITNTVFFIAWVMISQKLYPMPFRWNPTIISTIFFFLVLLIGYWLDDAQLDLLHAVPLKIGLVAFMAAIILWSGLLKFSGRVCLVGGLINDLQQIARRIRRRL